MEAAAEIRDPIHGYIYLNETERQVIDTPIFQRLRRIRQLAGAHLTYPGAQHSRFEHSVGCAHLASLVGRVLKAKADLDGFRMTELRLAALIHDTGHGPFSHIFEEVVPEKAAWTHETMTRRLLRETELGDIARRGGYDPEALSMLSTAQSSRHPGFMNDCIGGVLSVDIMDYLLRDSYFTGVEYGKVDVHRLINSLEVVEDRLALDDAALYAFEALAIARYEMFRAVYFHRAVRAAEIMLIRSMQLAEEDLHLTDFKDLGRYLELTDEVVLHKLTTLKSSGGGHLERARDWAIRYKDRRLVKCVFERLIQRRDRLLDRVFSQKRIRDEVAQQIARDAGIDPEFVFLDVSSAPSVPYTADREAFSKLTLVSKRSHDRRTETVPAENLPLLKDIMGFMDILRVYTLPEHREAAERAAEAFFGAEGFMTKISV